jgi:peptide subunit release factor 1 (eRF1)
MAEAKEGKGKISQQARQKLKHFVKELENFRGRHTELVSVYVPTGYNLDGIINHLQQEQGTASNIKSKTTRENVIAALERMIQHLKLVKRTPANGLVAFAGNVAEREGFQDYRVWSIEPPVPINVRLYRCDKEFILDPLTEMAQDKALYGLVVMDKRDATVAILKGKTIVPLVKEDSMVPGKMKAGGQCLSPMIIIKTKDKVKTIGETKVGEEIEAYDLSNQRIILTKVKNKWIVKKNKYIEINVEDCWQIICSEDHVFFRDEGKDKYKIIEVPAGELKVGDWLLTFDKNKKLYTVDIKEIKIIHKSIDMIDIETKQGNFFANGLLVHNSSVRFAQNRELAAKAFYKKIGEIMKDQFLTMGEELKGIIIGGPGPTKYEFAEGNFITNEVKKKIIGIKDLSYTDEFGLQELVERSEDLLANEEVAEEKKIMQKFFDTLGKTPAKASYGKDEVLKNLQLGAVGELLLSEALEDDVIDLYTAEAEKMNSTVYIISVETREGVQLKEIGKIAAILRYEIHQE